MHRIIFIALIIPTIFHAASSEKRPSHFEIPKPRPLQMIIVDEALRLFSDLKSYDQDATENYFGNKQKIDGSLLCARFILKELNGHPQELQYCKYVPVYTVLHQTTLITTNYELRLVPDSNGTNPKELIEKLCARYTREKQSAGSTEGDKKS